MRGQRLRASSRRRRLPSETESAAATGAAVVAAPGVVWPYWLQAQLDSADPAFLPLGEPPQARNLTHRNWTSIGTLDLGGIALVDPRGLVTPDSLVASLDWWVRGPGGWQYPSRDPEACQELVDDAPVVRTTIALKGGGTVSATATAAAGNPAAVVVEYRNDTDAPVALALVVRPWDPVGLLPVRGVAVGSDRIEVDGRPFVVFDGKPLLRAAAVLGGERLEAMLEAADAARAGEEDLSGDVAVRDRHGGATGAAVLVLGHGRTLRATLPTAGTGATAGAHAETPTPATVARGWAAQTKDCAGVYVPLSGAASAFAAQAGHLMTVRNPLTIGPEGLRALLYLGCHRHASGVIAAHAPAADRRLGASQGADSEGRAAVWLIGAYDTWCHTRDRELFERLETPLRRATAAVERSVLAITRRGNPRDGHGPQLRLAETALAAAARLAGTLGVDDVASAAPAIAASAREEVETRYSYAHEALGADAAAATAWLGVSLPGDEAVSDPKLVSVLAACGQHDGAGRIPSRSGGVDLVGTLRVAEASSRVGDPKAWELLQFALDAAAPTWTWPSVWNPRSGGGCAGSGQDLRVAALFVLALRQCIVAETTDGLALLPVPPTELSGAGTGGSRLPTPYGYLDLQVRRDGARTALAWRGLWGARTPVLSAPSLDPGWRTDTPAGSATLS